MGREIIVSKVKLVEDESGIHGYVTEYDDRYVCGRDSVTDAIADYFYVSGATDIVLRPKECSKDTYSLTLHYSSLQNETIVDAVADVSLQDFLEQLEDYSFDEDLRLKELTESFEDLKEARRHACTLSAFEEFTVAIKEYKSELDDIVNVSTLLLNFIYMTQNDFKSSDEYVMITLSE